MLATFNPLFYISFEKSPSEVNKKPPKRNNNNNSIFQGFGVIEIFPNFGVEGLGSI